MKLNLLLFLTIGFLISITSCKRSEGCLDKNACNYDPDAKKDDGSCIYILDCAGICGGDATFDECDICGGSGKTMWYLDLDSDGLGDPDSSISSCLQPQGYVSNSNDDFDAVPSSNKQRAILVYVGATWCPPCGQWGEEAKEHVENNFGEDQAIILSCQRADKITNSTEFGYSFGSEFQNYSGSTGIPHMHIRGGGYENDFYPSAGSFDSDINTVIGTSPTVGVCAIASLSGTTVTVKTKTRFFSASSEEHHVSVYLLEDNVIADQSHSSLGTVPDMPHDHVLRAAANESNYLGESIGSSFSSEQEVEGSYNIEIDPKYNQSTGLTTDWKAEDLKVTVIVWKGSGLNALNGLTVEVL